MTLPTYHIILGQASESPVDIMLIAIVAGSIIFVVGLLAFAAKLYQKVNQGQALIVNKPSDTMVYFTGAIVVPLIHRAEVMDISVKTIEIARTDNDGLICKDNIRADIRVTFFVRVNETKVDVLRVAKMVGCARASDQEIIEELFGAKFSEALKTAGKQFDFEALYQARQAFRTEIITAIGDDLNGYTLEDVAIDYLEQTNIQQLNPHNILDAEGIRKITARTEEQRVLTNELSNSARKKIGKDNLETKMATLEYERQQADAEAKQKREIDAVRAIQRAEAEEIKAQQISKERQAQLEAEETINVRSINKTREEMIAEKVRERAIIIEQESIEKERQLTIIEREREVDVKRIRKEREVEIERKEIAEVVRDRIAVEKSVAQEEEHIKDLRTIADAERVKKATIIRAEGEAQQKLVVDIKAAEANEEVAKFGARQRIIEADAQLDAADRIAKSKIRLAEGVQAESAAEGLATTRVEEAQAVVLEKRGLVEAKILKEKMQAEALGVEDQGMAQVRLREANAEARIKEGNAEADVVRGTMLAEATGHEEQGMAQARVREAEAAAIEKQGVAEAKVVREKLDAEASGARQKGLAQAQVAEALALASEKQGLSDAKILREKLLAEAAGITEKAEAMKQLDDVSRDHEEFRLRLEHERAITLERLRTNIDMGRAQAEVYAAAFEAANINIVGGDEGFYNNFLKSVSLGHSVDGFIQSSDTAKSLLDKFIAPKSAPKSALNVPRSVSAQDALCEEVTDEGRTQQDA